jgi:hypothetical protein
VFLNVQINILSVSKVLRCPAVRPEHAALPRSAAAAASFEVKIFFLPASFYRGGRILLAHENGVFTELVRPQLAVYPHVLHFSGAQWTRISMCMLADAVYAVWLLVVGTRLLLYQTSARHQYSNDPPPPYDW